MVVYTKEDVERKFAVFVYVQASSDAINVILMPKQTREILTKQLRVERVFFFVEILICGLLYVFFPPSKTVLIKTNKIG